MWTPVCGPGFPPIEVKSQSQVSVLSFLHVQLVEVVLVYH